MSTKPWSLLAVSLLLAGCMDEPSNAPAEPPSDAELDALCADRMAASSESAAIAAQDRVDGIADRLADREAELTKLEQQLRNDDKRAAASSAERKRLRGEVDQLRSDLQSAEQARDSARSELVATLKQLDAKMAEAEAARADADQQRARAERGEWTAFVAEAKNQICDRGTRKRHARCHDAVEVALSSDLKARFDTCTATAQAVPELRRMDKAAELPEFGVALADDRAFTAKGWAVVFCDPDLPETR